jgi:MFS family permease
MTVESADSTKVDMPSEGMLLRGVQQVTWRQWYMVAVLTSLYVLAFIDRQALVLLVGPIKQDLGMTDTQMSLLLGMSFAAFYAVLGLPAGYLVDRVSRRGIMGIGVVLWSCMTLSCGLARSYGQLFLGRCGVGIGEAAITPASYSLIRDAFPRKAAAAPSGSSPRPRSSARPRRSFSPVLRSASLPAAG